MKPATQLFRNIEKLARSVNPLVLVQADSFSGGVIRWASEGCNYLDNKIFYKYDQSDNNYNRYKLHITLDFDGVFSAINHSYFEIKE